MIINQLSQSLRPGALRLCLVLFFGMLFFAAPTGDVASQTLPPQDPVVEPANTVPDLIERTVAEDSGANDLALPDLGDGISITATAGPSNGDLALTNSDTNMTYTPDANYCNSIDGPVDVIEFQLSDEDDLEHRVEITVTCVNDPPVITPPGSISAGYQTETKVGVTTVSDVDLNGGDIRVTLSVAKGVIEAKTTTGLTVTTNSSASATLEGALPAMNVALGDIYYTPNNDIFGADTLTIVANDLGNSGSGGAKQDSKTVNISIDDPSPSINADTATLTEDTPQNIDVLANDNAGSANATMDVDSVNVTQDPGKGDTEVQPNGKIRYLPDQNATGSDTFRYSACNSVGNCGNAQVTVTITPVNDRPFISPIDNQWMVEGSQRTVIATVNDVDGANGALNVTASADNKTLFPDANVTVSAGDNDSQRRITLRPTAGRTGNATISVTVRDNGSPSESASTTFIVTVIAPNLYVSIDDGGTSVRPGDTVSYVVGYGNSGTAQSTGARLEINVPANTTFDSGESSSGWSCSSGAPAGTPCALPIGTLTSGATGNSRFGVRVNSNIAENVDEINASIRISDDGNNGDDIEPGNNTDNDMTPINRSVLLTATKRDEPLPSDDDGNTGPGDTVIYAITVRNDGLTPALGVEFTDTPDANSTLAVSSVSTSQGIITSGNSAGDSSVTVNLGTLNAGASVSVEFRVQINATQPEGVNSIANQGTFSGQNFPNVRTDDPDTSAANDATITPFGDRPDLTALKVDSLFEDSNGNGVPSPGEVLLYTIELTNRGQGEATNVLFEDVPGDFTSLIAGTVTASLPSAQILRGNGGGANDVAVLVPQLANAESVTITFKVRIDGSLPFAVVEIANQGRVASAELATILTDDPDTPQVQDATRTTVATVPVLRTTKSAAVTDLNGDGNGPGDLIDYTIVIRNDGTAASEIVVTDPLSPSLTLTPTVAGGVLVQTDRGVVTTGLDPADRSVVVAVGPLGGGERATITFRVKIADALPAGLTFIENQAVITGLGIDESVSDDPSTIAVNDPTQTPVTAAVILKATLKDFPTDFGPIKDGARLLYNPVIDNRGNSAATDVSIVGSLSPHTVLIADSIQAGRGTIVRADSNSFEVVFDVIPAGQLAALAIEVTVTNLPTGGLISNQFSVTASNLDGVVMTDDPDTESVDDPTETRVFSLIDQGDTWLPIIWGE